MPRIPIAVAVLALAGALCGAAAFTAADPAASGPTVSQRDRTFAPGAVSLRRGQTLTILNDDERVIHHAYVEDPGLRYDSGDQTPGDKAAITFPDAGAFQVLCGIHPRMRLDVTVR